MHLKRSRSPLIYLGSLLLVLALPILARAAYRYQSVGTWMQQANRTAEDFRWTDVTGIAAGRDGRVYVSHQSRNRPILVFDQNGKFLESWGGGITEHPHSVRVDPDGNVWVVDYVQHEVLKFTADGRLLDSVGSTAGEDAYRFNNPADIAFGPNGDIYIADGHGNDRVVQYDRNLTYIRAWGRGGRAPGQFSLPHGIAVDAQGRVFVADRENRRIQIFTADGQYITHWRLRQKPYSLYITPDQLIYVAYGHYDVIGVLDMNGRQVTRFGRTGRRVGQMIEPHMISVDEQGAIYVAEGSGKRAQKFAPVQ